MSHTSTREYSCVNTVNTKKRKHSSESREELNQPLKLTERVAMAHTEAGCASQEHKRVAARYMNRRLAAVDKAVATLVKDCGGTLDIRYSPPNPLQGHIADYDFVNHNVTKTRQSYGDCTVASVPAFYIEGENNLPMVPTLPLDEVMAPKCQLQVHNLSPTEKFHVAIVLQLLTKVVLLPGTIQKPVWLEFERSKIYAPIEREESKSNCITATRTFLESGYWKYFGLGNMEDLIEWFYSLSSTSAARRQFKERLGAYYTGTFYPLLVRFIFHHASEYGNMTDFCNAFKKIFSHQEGIVNHQGGIVSHQEPMSPQGQESFEDILSCLSEICG